MYLLGLALMFINIVTVHFIIIVVVVITFDVDS